MRYLLLIFWVLFYFSVNAQVLTFVPKFKNVPIVLNNKYFIENDTLIITSFKFYISNLQYFKDNTLVYTSSKKAYLIDITKEQSLQINETESIEFDKIKFNIGIDSLINVSGVFDEDLDPVNGMYWTWQSGYINFKLEGIATHCPARNNKFYWHIGGYFHPFYAMREIILDCKANSPIELVIQIDELFKKINVAKVYQVMSPNENAIQIADVLPRIFKIGN